MADNVTADSGSGGATFAADDIGGVHFPRTKLIHGADGTNDGDVSSANPLPVDVISALPAGTNAIGKLAANDGVDIGDTDVTSVVPGTGATNLGKAEDAAHTTGDTGVAALAVRRDTAAAGSGADGDYSTLNVDGSGRLWSHDPVAVALLTTMDADTSSLAGAVSGSELQVDLVDGNVTNAGTFVVQEDGAALTALQLIDDIVATDDTSTHATGTTKGAVMMAAATPTDGSVDANDLGALAMSTDRRLLVDAQIAGQDADVTIADGGNSITVDNAGLTALNGAISGTEVQVDLVAADVTNAGTFAVQVDGDALTALQLLDDIVATDDTSTHATGSTKGAVMMAAATPTDGSVGANDIGALSMSTDRRLLVDAQIAGQDADVTIADGGNSITVDNAGLTALDNAISGTEVQVDVVAALPAGTNAIGKLAANDGVDIGDVDVASVPADPFGANADAASTTGSISAKLRQLATDLDAVRSGTELQVDVVAALPAGTNAIGKLAANDGVDIGDVDVTSISAGSNLIGDVGLSGARTSGGTTLYKNIDVDESEDQIKGTAGQVYWIHCVNLDATPVYLKFYNATAASVTVGTTVPDLTFAVPTSGDSNGAGFTLSIPNGIAFSTAITVAATTGVADADSTGPGTNEVILNLGYA